MKFLPTLTHAFQGYILNRFTSMIFFQANNRVFYDDVLLLL